MKKALLLVTVLLVFLLSESNAQTPKSTYLYLEVNKELPVNIKLNGRAVRNERKGYLIIPKLAEGENILEFNFMNPNFRTHRFKIDNTNKRSMGLNLMRVSGNRYVLQDVVTKRIISDETTLKAEPIAVASSAEKTKTNPPQRGIVKVYEAKKTTSPKETTTVTSTKSKTSTKPSTNNILTAATSTQSSETRSLAMYKNRKPLTPEARANRYKDYGKIKRAKKKAARANKKMKKTVETPEMDETPQVKNPVVKKPKAPKTKVDQTALRAAEARKKEAEKEAKRIAREKELEAKKEQDRIEYARLEKERALRKEKRLEKKKLRAQEAEITSRKKEKKTEAVQKDEPKRKKKNYEKELNIDEKIINAEPTGNTGAVGKHTDFDSKDQASLIRCKSSIDEIKVAEWASKLHKKFDDEARENFVKKKLGTKCISTNNLGIVLENMETQIGRYKLIRTLYPKLEDPSNINRFDQYFQSKSFITKLKELNLNQY